MWLDALWVWNTLPKVGNDAETLKSHHSFYVQPRFPC